MGTPSTSSQTTTGTQNVHVAISAHSNSSFSCPSSGSSGSSGRQWDAGEAPLEKLEKLFLVSRRILPFYPDAALQCQSVSKTVREVCREYLKRHMFEIYFSLFKDSKQGTELTFLPRGRPARYFELIHNAGCFLFHVSTPEKVVSVAYISRLNATLVAAESSRVLLTDFCLYDTWTTRTRTYFIPQDPTLAAEMVRASAKLYHYDNGQNELPMEFFIQNHTQSDILFPCCEGNKVHPDASVEPNQPTNRAHRASSESFCCYRSGSSSSRKTLSHPGRSPLEDAFSFGILSVCTDLAFQCQPVSRRLRTICLGYLNSQMALIDRAGPDLEILTPNPDRSPSFYYRFIHHAALFLHCPVPQKVAPLKWIQQFSEQLIQAIPLTMTPSSQYESLSSPEHRYFIPQDPSRAASMIFGSAYLYHNAVPPCRPMERNLWISSGRTFILPSGTASRSSDFVTQD